MQPEFFSAAFMSALFAIVLIDLVLAGDNALIIGLVA
jgi:predicted tellurium resistance membrane protein TerC